MHRPTEMIVIMTSDLAKMSNYAYKGEGAFDGQEIKLIFTEESVRVHQCYVYCFLLALNQTEWFSWFQ